MKLWEIQEEYEQIAQKLAESDGVMSEELEKRMNVTAENLRVKAMSYGRVVVNLTAEVAALNTEIARLNERKRMCEKEISHVRRRVGEAMRQFDVDKLSDPFMTLVRAEYEHVEITNDRIIPQNLMTVRTTLEPSKTKIKELLKAGIEVDGARIVTDVVVHVK